MSALVLVAGLSLGSWFVVKAQNSPDAVFNDFLRRSLQLKQVTQSQTFGGNGTTIAYDLEDVRNAKVNIVTNLVIGDVTLNYEAYGTAKDDFFKITSSSPARPSDDMYLDKWVQLRKDGAWANDSASSLANLLGANSRLLILGDIIFGNFSAAEQSELFQAMSNKQIYDYDSGKVTSDSVAGYSVFVYEVTTHKEALKALNKKAAKIMGVSDQDLQVILDNLDNEPATVKLFIAKDSHRIIQAQLAHEDSVVENTYSYTQPSLLSQPQPELSYDEFDRYWSQF